MAMLISVMSFADTYTHTFKSGELKVGTVTLSGISWTGEGTVPFWGFDSNNGRGLQIGSGSNPCKAFSLSTSGFEGTITEVVVNASMASSGTAKLSISVGGTSYLSNKALTTTATNYTATGAASGDLVISYTNTAKAFYIKSISVTYELGEEDPDATKYTVTTNVNDKTMGTVTGAGEYAEGTTVTLTAAANPGYNFVNWSNGETANPLKLTVTENVEITANFEAIPQMTCAEAAAAAKDEVVVLNPFDVVYVVKDAGYIYIKDESGVNLIYDFNLDDKLKAGDHVEGFVGVSSPYNGLPEIKASVTFEDLTVTPGTTTAPTVMAAAPTAADVNKYIKLEKVTFSSAATFATSSATNATMVVNGTNVTLRNQFKLSKSFVKNGVYDITGFAAVYNSTVQIYYLSATKLSLTISATANGGTVTGTGEFMEGDKVTLTATANEGYEFVNWTWGPEEMCKTAEYTFTVEEDMNLIANFKKIEYTVAATASEGGTVTGLAEEGKYEHGATATLTAIANEGYEFVNWTKGEEVVSTEAEYTFTVTENVTLVANFKEVVVEPTYDFDVVAKDLYMASDEVMTQIEGSNSMNPDNVISVTLWASEYGTYTCAGTDDDQFSAFYMGYPVMGELTYSYSEELKSDLVVIIGTITDEENVTSTVRITMYEEYLEPTDVVVLNNLSKTVQGRGPWASLMLHTALQDTIITISGCDGTYGKYTAWGTFGTLELEGKGEWKNEGENDVFVGVLYNADKTKVFQVTASTPAEAAPEAKEYRFEVSNIDFFIDLEGDFYIYCASEEDAEVPFNLELILYGWKGAGNYGIGEMAGTIYTIDYMDGADVANMNSEIEVIVEDGKVIIIGQVEDIDGNIYNLSLEGAEPQADDDDPTTGVENLDGAVAPVKMIKNGQLIIRNNGVEFNAQGAVVK